VDEWAGLVMKIEGKSINPKTGKEVATIISYDNMYSRLINGTNDFKKYEIVLDVPDSSSTIEFGGRLTGAGQIWFERLKLDIVDKDVPVTSSDLKEPTNLDFDK